ncbi:MAG: NfeD family protein [Bacteroidota bacterium]
MALFKFFRLFRKKRAKPSQPEPIKTDMIGRKGRTLTPLKIFGYIDIDGKEIEVMSSKGFIPSGCLVKIIEKRMGWYLVEPQ